MCSLPLVPIVVRVCLQLVSRKHFMKQDTSISTIFINTSFIQNMVAADTYVHHAKNNIFISSNFQNLYIWQYTFTWFYMLHIFGNNKFENKTWNHSHSGLSRPLVCGISGLSAPVCYCLIYLQLRFINIYFTFITISIIKISIYDINLYYILIINKFIISFKVL